MQACPISPVFLYAAGINSFLRLHLLLFDHLQIPFCVRGIGILVICLSVAIGYRARMCVLIDLQRTNVPARVDKSLASDILRVIEPVNIWCIVCARLHLQTNVRIAVEVEITNHQSAILRLGLGCLRRRFIIVPIAHNRVGSPHLRHIPVIPKEFYFTNTVCIRAFLLCAVKF